MKLRFKNEGLANICVEYPKCNCEGHLIYEKNKKHSVKED